MNGIVFSGRGNSFSLSCGCSWDSGEMDVICLPLRSVSTKGCVTHRSLYEDLQGESVSFGVLKLWACGMWVS